MGLRRWVGRHRQRLIVGACWITALVAAAALAQVCINRDEVDKDDLLMRDRANQPDSTRPW
jgi:hypothetical protein